MVSKGKIRNSNLELLRILCMMMIIGSHYAHHGAGNNWSMLRSAFSVNHVIATILGSWGQLGVYGFILISCYFMTEKSLFSSKRIFMLIGEVVFYNLIYCFIGVLSGEAGLKTIVKELLTPLWPEGYWFITTYIVFYLIEPFLKILASQLTKEMLMRMCIILTLFVPCYNLLWDNVGGYLGNFVYAYFLITYLKGKENCFFEKYARIGFITMTCSIIIVSLMICIFGTITGLDIILGQTTRISGRNIFIVLDALFMFYFFKNLKVKNSKVINTIGRATLGVYIIHDNIFLCEGNNSILWDRILKINEWYTSPWFILHMVISIIAIFAVCTIIEILRIMIVDDLLLVDCKFLNRICKRFDEWYLPKEKYVGYTISK